MGIEPSIGKLRSLKLGDLKPEHLEEYASFVEKALPEIEEGEHAAIFENEGTLEPLYHIHNLCKAGKLKNSKRHMKAAQQLMGQILGEKESTQRQGKVAGVAPAGTAHRHAQRLTEGLMQRTAQRALEKPLRMLEGPSGVPLLVGSKYEEEKVRGTLQHVHAIVELGDLVGKTDARSKQILKEARKLYESLFPSKDEREDWELITNRLLDMKKLEAGDAEKQAQYGDSRFHSFVLLNGNGEVIGYTQFTTLPVGDDKVAMYTQYSGIRPDYRGKELYHLIRVLRHGAVSADATRMGRNPNIVFGLSEAEYLGQVTPGRDQEQVIGDMVKTYVRIATQNAVGAKAMVLVLDNGLGGETLQMAHMQPRLSADTNPIMLMFMVWDPVIDPKKLNEITTMDKELAYKICETWIANFDREKFDPKDVDEARQIILGRVRAAKEIRLTPLKDLPNYIQFAAHDEPLLAQMRSEVNSRLIHPFIEAMQKVLKSPKVMALRGIAEAG